MKTVPLQDRALVSIAGTDAETLLQNVITSDLAALSDDVACPSALLTPQGKIIFDFLIARDGPERFLVDIAADAAGDFIRRMTLYRLRAKAEIALVSDRAVHAAWGDGDDGEDAGATGLKDLRFGATGGMRRLYAANAPSDDAAAARAEYEARRVAGGVAECGRDYPAADAFPHDVLLDRNGGVSFRKGCFVGQEVVSRMQHRGTARRRVMVATAEADGLPATSGDTVVTGGRAIGTLGTIAGRHAIAIVRTDRVAEAEAADAPITVGAGGGESAVAITLAFPAWTGLLLPDPTTAAEGA